MRKAVPAAALALALCAGAPFRAAAEEKPDLAAELDLGKVDPGQAREFRSIFKLLGYTVAEDGSVYFPYDPKKPGEKRKVTNTEVFGDYNEAQSLDANIRSMLQESGKYRVDEPGGRILLRIDDDRSRPLSPLEAKVALHTAALLRRDIALETIHVNCNCHRMTPDRKALIELLAKLEKDGLPPDLLAAIRVSQAAPSLAAMGALFPGPGSAMLSAIGPLADRQVRISARQAYENSRRAFDGSRPVSDLVVSALPPAPGARRPALPPAYFDRTERRLGELMSEAVETTLGENPVGRRVLKNLDGKLPAFTIIRIGAEKGGNGYGLPGAFYNPETKSVTFIQDHFYPGLRGRALALGVPDRVADSWAKDPRRLAEFLTVTDPEDGRSGQAAKLRLWIAESHGTLLAHELTHTWQDARSKLDTVALRGGLPYAIEREKEAFRVQNEFLHAKLQAALKAADQAGGEKRAEILRGVARDPYFANYLSFIGEPQRWGQDIVRHYQSMPGGATDFDALALIQQERKKISCESAREAKEISWDSAMKVLRHALNYAGIVHGDEAIAEEKKAHSTETDRFFRETYPAMRVEGARALGAALVDSPTRSFLYLRLASELSPKDEQFQKDAVAAAKKAAAFLADPPKGTAPGEVFGWARGLHVYLRSQPDSPARVEGFAALAPVYDSLQRPDLSFLVLSDSKAPIPAAAAAKLEDGSWLKTVNPTVGERLNVCVSLERYYGSNKTPWPAWLKTESEGHSRTLIDIALTYPAGSPSRASNLKAAENFLPLAPEGKRDELRRLIEQSRKP